MVARAPARPITRGRPGASRRRAPGSRRHPRHLRGKPTVPAPCYRQSLELFAAAGDEIEAAHMLRIAANMFMRGEAAAAWPLLEESLQTSRQLGNRLGECQALGFLTRRAYADGDLALAVDQSLRRRRHCPRGRLGVVGGRPAPRCLHLRARAWTPRCRRSRRSVPWGSLSTSATGCTPSSPAPSWRSSPQSAGTPGPAGAALGARSRRRRRRTRRRDEENQARIKALVLRVDGPAFASARAEGSLLSIARPPASSPLSQP